VRARLPALSGAPIRVSFLPALSNCRGDLLSGEERGVPVLAASYLRRREIVLDEALLGQPRNLARLLAHELFHFVWLRLGNPGRSAYEALLRAEFRAGAGGELGWSAEYRKAALTPADRRHRTRRWREYACESFCDTAGWLAAGGPHPEFTLDAPRRPHRRDWFAGHVFRRKLSI
jgi:hypothetical protein